jgi:DNA-binding NtrC family response regulator
MKTVLIVDDEASQRELMNAVLEGEGYHCVLARNGSEGLEAVTTAPPDLVLLDVRMDGIDGLETLARIRAVLPNLPVVMVTAHGDVTMAVEAMKRGASDFVQKPVDINRLRDLVHALVEERSDAGTPDDEANAEVNEPRELVGISEAAAGVRHLCRVAARSMATVLVTGESGTGKEVVAQAIHRLSARRASQFVAVNCAALPGTLLESELFGHERGAFTGAVSRKIGLFESAHGSTLLLDEVAEMSPGLQTRLLRVLQERVLERIGGNQPVRVDVRVIAATNKDVHAAVADGSLREDLYYRINVLHIHVPPLRERPEDVLILARHFLEKHGGDRRCELSPSAAKRLAAHDWPGNVRELENAIERALLFVKGRDILPEHLPPPLGSRGAGGEAETGVRPGWSLQEVERDLIVKTLKACDGNRTRAARELGLSRRTLQIKIKRYGLE